MKKIILFVMSFFIASSIIYSQNRLSLNIGEGYYLSNSENYNYIMGDEEFTYYLFYGIAYRTENLLGNSFEFEYGFHEITKENTVIFDVDSQSDPVSSIAADVELINHTFDLNYVGKLDSRLLFGVGPSFVITNRTIEVKNPDPQGKTPLLYDKLASSGLGLNGFLSYQVPFTKGKNGFYFTSKIKLRYTYSIWFDEGIRKLDDYYQEFFTIQLSVGVGYSF